MNVRARDSSCGTWSRSRGELACLMGRAVMAALALLTCGGLAAVGLIRADVGFQLTEIGSFQGYKGGTLVRSEEVIVYEQLNGGNNLKEGTVPEGCEGIGGEVAPREKRIVEVSYKLKGNLYREVNRRCIDVDEVPDGVLEMDECDRLNDRSILVDEATTRLLPAGVLIKDISSVQLCGKESSIIAYTTESPPGSTNEFGLYIAVVDQDRRLLQKVLEVDRYVSFEKLGVGDLTGDGVQDIAVHGCSIGGSGYAKTVRIYATVCATGSVKR